MGIINTEKAAAMLPKADSIVETINKERRRLNGALFVLEEIDRRSEATNVEILIHYPNGQSASVMDVFEPSEVLKYIRDKATKTVNDSYEKLAAIMGEHKPADELPGPEQQPEPITETESKSKRVKVDEDMIEHLYFKQGKTTNEIAEEMGLGYSTVCKYVKEIKERKELTAKECVRHG